MPEGKKPKADPGPESAPFEGAGAGGEGALARYQILGLLAEGGTGRVFEATDLDTEKQVAVKMLNPAVAQDPVALARFKREFAVSKELPHEYIVEVYDFQPTPDGSYALVMELLRGEELRECLKRDRVLAPARLIRMASQLAIGLSEAHQRRWVHRDLKPDNIFLCVDSLGDRVKILDFGSVKDTGGDAPQITVLGTTIGSPYYMSPEQAQSLESLDHRADVWALAAICYQCLTGEVPFKGVHAPSILLSILTKEADAASGFNDANPGGIPPEVDAVFERAFQKAASERTASVADFVDELGQAYGLVGGYQRWARLSEVELSGLLISVKPDASGGLRGERGGAAPRRFQGEQVSSKQAELLPGAEPKDEQVAVANTDFPSGNLLYIGLVGALALLVGVGLVVLWMS